ncbi:SpoIIE family protein phosphatase [Streptomyces sp. NPDC006552]|uniref:PP2C family protein-serine/threonine phosphatase n=1 Tax=Streptomyces sp. NPDC006552 TaxID=3157179 RepID=UPI0033A8A7DA
MSAIQQSAPHGAVYGDTDEHRQAGAVRRYRMDDIAFDGGLDRIASLAARIFDAPMACVTMADGSRAWTVAAYGFAADRMRCEPNPWTAAVTHGGVHVVSDALTDPPTAAHTFVRELGARFCAAAAITAPDGQRLGTVDVFDVRPRIPTQEQLETLQDLAALVMNELEMRRSAQQTVTAERQRRTEAERLARTLLPPVLPTVPGLRTAAAYHTASADEVGGDFYDLFPLDDGRWAFFLGDVCGKGADAAALTSLTRYTLRAAAIYDPDPCAALANLDAVLKGEYQGDSPRFCTAVFGVLDGAADGTFSVTLASGGHPPALVLRADGPVEPLSTSGGQLIGLLPRPRFVQTTTRLAPGEALLLYTDGLTEARTADGSRLGEDGLTRHLSAHSLRTADGLLATVHTLFTDLGTGVSDDIALLALSAPSPAPASLQHRRKGD